MDNPPEKLTITLYDAILDFMLSNPTTEQIAEFKLPAHLEDQVHTIFEHNSAGTISAGERAELEELLRIDHFFTMLKVRARHKSQHMNQ